jgi:hypothetical protein
MGYRLIDLSSNRLIIEQSVQFEESVSHAPQQPHADTFIRPPVRDDEHAHADSSSDESFDSEDSNDLDLESVQSDAESEHPDAVAESEQRPKWASTTLQDAGDLIGDPIDTRRTRSDFEEPPFALTAKNHCPLGIFSLFSLQIHSLMARLLEIPFGNPPCRSTNPSSRTILGIWFPFLLGRNFSDADGSIGPRAQQMDRLEDTKPGLLPKAFSRFMVLTMMRPSLQ